MSKGGLDIATNLITSCFECNRGKTNIGYGQIALPEHTELPIEDTQNQLSRFNRSIRITKEDLEWIKKHKGKKSAAGFLEQIINEHKNGRRRATQNDKI